MTDKRKVALVTGITGQDGAYLAEFLLSKGYIVHGIKRRSSSFNTGRIEHIYQDPHESNQRFILHYGDMTDSTNLIRIVQESKPDEIYNLAPRAMCGSPSRRRNTPPMPTASARCGFWKPSASLGLRRPRASTRPRPRSFTALSRKCRSARPRPSIRAAPMRRPSSIPTGSWSITARPMACMPPTASCSTTKARCAARPS